MLQALRELPVGARQWGVHIRIHPVSSAPKGFCLRRLQRAFPSQNKSVVGHLIRLSL